MKTSLDHLPLKKQRELARVRDIVFEEFENLTVNATAQWKKKARLIAIILYGSYARGEWVDELTTGKGYRSDFDILVIVSNAKLADPLLWSAAEDRINFGSVSRTPVQLIVEPLSWVNEKLSEGRYFYADIKKEGIALYQLKGKKLADARSLTPKEGYEQAKDYFETTLPYAAKFLHTSIRQAGDKNIIGRRYAAFELHQATEYAYAAVLLTLTLYRPRTHNIEKLRSLCEDLDHRLIDVWPRFHQRHRARFRLLKRAYVEARYSKHYEITSEELTWLIERVGDLHKVTQTVCEDQLAKLQQSL